MVSALYLIGGFIYIGATLVLQAVGVFTPNWVVRADCNSTGLFYFCCGGIDNDTCVLYGDSDKYIAYDRTSLVLHAISLGLMILGLIQLCCVCCTCCSCDDDDDSSFSVFFIGCYPLSGIFSLVGCILLDIHYPWRYLGYSYKLCLTSGLINGLVLFCLCYGGYKAVKSEESEQTRSTTVTRREMTPYVIGNASVEQTSIEASRDSQGTIRIIARKTKINLVSAFRK